MMADSNEALDEEGMLDRGVSRLSYIEAEPIRSFLAENHFTRRKR
jgi:hypothetical protein